MFFLQILYGNAACEFVPHLAGKDVTGSAYCTARGRLPLAALQILLARCTTKMAECVRDTGLWLGHRLFLLDGSSFSMPDTAELQEHFGQPGGPAAGCGFPTAHWLALVHFGSGLFQKVIYLGPLDQIVEWFRPAAVPAWLTAEAWAALPTTIRVRELRYTTARPGSLGL
jgi:hypothetical protein